MNAQQTIHAVDTTLENSQLPLSSLVKNPELNPRKHSNSSDFESLKESMSRHCERFGKGRLIQPIVVRALPDLQFEIVAGNRRYDSAKALGWETIDVSIRSLDDAQAKELAGEENIIRSQMTVIEEADHAKMLMADSDNDKEEVRRRLGWTTSMLESRLLLTHCIDVVREALAEKSILIGHAELLATMPEELQEKALSSVVTENLSVSETQERVVKLARKIAGACFNTNDCKTCPNNTSLYVDMFEAVDADALCTNGSCWQEKTIARLHEIHADKSEEFGTVKFSTDVPSGSTMLLAPAGDFGVGRDQLAECGTCTNYGCVISAVVGHEGKLQEGVCFDRKCHAEKVSIQKDIIASTQTNTSQPSPSPSSTAGAEKPKKPEAKSAASKTTVKAVNKGIKRHVFKRFCSAAQHEVSKDVILQKAVSIVGLAAHLPTLTYPDFAKFVKSGMNSSDTVSKLMMLTGEELDHIINIQSQCYLTKLDNEDSFEKDRYRSICLVILANKKTDMSEHWVMDAEYLKANNKDVVIALLNDSGFADAYDDRMGKGSFSKLKKVGELHKAVESFKFDFTGFLPKPTDYSQYLK